MEAKRSELKSSRLWAHLSSVRSRTPLRDADRTSVGIAAFWPQTTAGVATFGSRDLGTRSMLPYNQPRP